MEQGFDQKRGLSDEDLRKIDERERQLSIQFRATRTIRIISGGKWSDFGNLKKAVEFMLSQLQNYHHASINVRCPIIRREKCQQITSSVLQ